MCICYIREQIEQITKGAIMVNNLKRIISILLVLVVFTSGNSIAFAKDKGAASPADIVWNYTIYDKNMQVIKTGTFSNPSSTAITPQYTWDTDVTLNNGESVFFVPSTDYRGLYCLKGTKMTIAYTLSRSAYHEASVRGYAYGPDAEYLVSITASSLRTTYTAQQTDYYWGRITNYSSDPFTVRSFSITF